MREQAHQLGPIVRDHLGFPPPGSTGSLDAVLVAALVAAISTVRARRAALSAPVLSGRWIAERWAPAHEIRLPGS